MFQNAGGGFYDYDKEPFDINYHNQLEIYPRSRTRFVNGTDVALSVWRALQSGTFRTDTTFTNPPGLVPMPFANASDTTNASAATSSGSPATTSAVEPLERVWLTGGLACDDLTYPLNYRYPPVAPGETERSWLGPKAAAVWQSASAGHPPRRLHPLPRGHQPRRKLSARTDPALRLSHNFRSLIPESVVGSVEAPEYQTLGVALDLKFPSGTYAGIEFDHLTCNVAAISGCSRSTTTRFTLFRALPPKRSITMKPRSPLRSTNCSARASFSASVTILTARMLDVLPDVPVAALPSANQNWRAGSPQTSGYVLFNHPSGLFARADATWYHQSNSGYTPALPGDDFVQENLYVGYRFRQRRAEPMFGVLNLSGVNYNLNPLSTYMELPRERTYIVRLNFIF